MRYILLSLFMLLASSQAMGADTHFCNCDGLAVAACVAGAGDTFSAGVSEGTAALPYQSWETARTTFTSASAGDEVRLCRGGSWEEASPSTSWLNTACTVASPCKLTDYDPSWNDEGQYPVAKQTDFNGGSDTLASALTTDGITTLTVTSGTCPSDLATAGIERALHVEDNNGWYRRITYGATSPCTAGVYTITNTNGYEDFGGTGIYVNASAGNDVLNFSTTADPTLMGFSGTESTLYDGIHISNIDFRGPLVWLQGNTGGGTGFQIVGHKDSFTFDNIKVSGFGNGFNVRFNAQDPDFMDDWVVTNNEIFNNSGSGWLGGTKTMTFKFNHIHDNGEENALEHNMYLSRISDDSVISHNIFGPSNQGTAGFGCQGANIIAHNKSARVEFAHNVMYMDPADAASNCWATGFDGGNSSPEEFDAWWLHDNLIYGFGRGITMGATINAIVENNVIINADTAGNASFVGVDLENGNGQFSEADGGAVGGDSGCEPSNCDTASTNNTVRNNSILFLSGSRGTAIQLGEQGANHDVYSNAIKYVGTGDSTFNCFGNGAASAYDTFDNNVCDYPLGEYFDTVGSLATWVSTTVFGDNSSEADPEFTDVAGSAYDEFDLSPSSPSSIMLDAGHASSAATARGYLQRDASPDIGAYEYLVPAWGDNLDSGIGMNLEWNRYEKPRVAFANAMKSARIWQNAITTCGTSTSTFSGTVTATGYPTAISGDCIFTGLFSGAHADGAWPLGTYTLEWTGSATMVVGGAAGTLSGGGTTSPATFVVDSTTGGFWVGISAMTSQVSDMRIYPPGGVCDDNPAQLCSTADCPSGVCPEATTCSGTCTALKDTTAGTFHPLWLSRLGQYHTLRFMNWLHINHSQVVNYSEWKPEGWYTYEYAHMSGVVGNVPLATIADLCNEVNAACYVNIPVQATDAHMTSFAEFFRDNVNSWLPVYLEFSNEVWNTGFQQHDDAAAAALAADGASYSGSTCGGTDPQKATCANNWHAKRTYEMCDLAQTAFDATGQGSQLVCVLGSVVRQTGTEFAEKVDCAQWTDSPSGNCYTGSDIDAVAVNVYLGGEGDCTAGMTMQEACTAAALDIPLKLCDGASCPIKEMNDELSSRSLSWRMMVYEGGSHMNDSGVDGCVEMTTSPDSCIGDVYADALDEWKTLDATYNLGEFIFFDQSGRQWASAGGNLFGHRGSNEMDWPKEAALMSWDNTTGNECWWTDCTLSLSEAITTIFAPWLVP